MSLLFSFCRRRVINLAARICCQKKKETLALSLSFILCNSVYFSPSLSICLNAGVFGAYRCLCELALSA